MGSNLDVAGYVRVSTEQQRDEGSHEKQRERLTEWADRNGHDLVVFEDIAISGQAAEREAYEELMGRAEEFDAVVVRELSRFGRSLQQVLRDIERLNEKGVKFISVTEDFSTNSAMGKAMMQMIGVFNEFWANLARERANEMVQRRREQGEHIGRPKLLNDSQIEQCREWNEQGLSYSAIATLAQDAFGVDVSRQTVYRYCSE